MTTTKKKKEAHVRFTEAEYARVQVQAKAAGRSVSEYLRQSALKEKTVQIVNGKDIAHKLGYLHNKMIQYRDDMNTRLDELKDSVQAYTAMMEEYGKGLPCSPTVTDTANLLNMRVDAAANILYRAYGEFENQTEEKLQQILQDVQP